MTLFGPDLKITAKDLVDLWRKTPLAQRASQMREFASFLSDDEIVAISEALHDEWSSRNPLGQP